MWMRCLDATRGHDRDEAMSLAPVSYTASIAMHGLAWFGGKR